MKLNFHKNHRLLFGVVVSGFIILSLMIAVFPAMWVQEQNKPLPDSKPLTDLQRKGLKVFVDNGCMYCHTQQVRPIPQDKHFGRPSTPGDYAHINRMDVWRQTPAVLGSERTGPDLTNIGKRQPSKTWQYMHLYQPRSVVKESIMPAFKWLFKVKDNPDSDDVVVPVPDGFGPKSGKVVATERAKALVAYLLSLKQVPLPNKATAAQTQNESSGGSGQTSGTSAAAKVNGANIFSSRCSSCHQSNGQGIQGTFPPLAGDPVVTADDPSKHIKTVLNGAQGRTINGVTYSSPMPAFGEILSDEEVAAVINHERSSWGNDAPTITPNDVAEIRNKE